MHRPAPRWLSHLALGLALVAIIGFGVKWLLMSPSDVVMPAATQGETGPAMADASEAPPEAPPAAAEAAPAPAVTGAEPAEAVDPAVAAVATVVEEKPSVEETASYRLAIKPWGTVYVDGKERGVSPPLKKLALTPGKHKIRIVNPNYPDFLMDVNLSKNKSGTIEHDFAADSQ